MMRNDERRMEERRGEYSSDTCVLQLGSFLFFLVTWELSKIRVHRC